MAHRRLGKVFVGMSGGVDSSVSAYLLKKQGYEVVGIHLKCWNKKGCDEQEARDARLVANKLEIPFYVFDMEKEYKERVVDYMIDSYRNGLTPNPDVMCNKEIKFGLFFEKALSMGADFIATGHYAKLIQEGEKNYIYAAKDANKDQSYFLWTLEEEKLGKVIFPLGDITKEEVRRIAKDAGLHVADKKDSQGICFIGQVTLQEFLNEYLENKEGNVLNVEGAVIGTHEGAHLYTIGQRHGLGVALNKPHYVLDKDIEANTVVLAEGDAHGLERSEVSIRDFRLNEGFSLPSKVFARVRYRQDLHEAVLDRLEDNLVLRFSQPVRFVAPGQSAVFYDGKGRLLGGGIIL
ncbi:MAG: tRNA 2-thiouridine(34) synthase MnmA [Candidatus Colwellbacteria bacterium]|nr:tRNA 2-thiouridine(34) synthase MnmA [Candidatus Colwellbacteria bacterium]